MNHQLAEKLTALLLDREGSIFGCWIGKMSKKEQLDLFGRYFGKGSIIINGENETVTHSVKVSFGQDVEWTAQMKWDGREIFDNRKPYVI